MSLIRLIVCVTGVYSMFLWWAVAQERLSVPFKTVDGLSSHKFRSALILGMCQSILCCFSAFIYIMIRKDPKETLAQALGVARKEKDHSNGIENGHEKSHKHDHGKPDTRFDTGALLLRYFQCSLLITSAAPFGFAALSYISYPAMVLGKSCKLVPVMIMNFLLYRRKFAPHKYLVVFIVTSGITVFMGFGNDQSKKHKSSGQDSDSPYASIIGMSYLLINLALDGAINSTQDEIFARFKINGQQMMFWINLFSTAISFTLSILPLPYIPVIHPSTDGKSELVGALNFISTHPSISMPLAEFAATGALGQLFIFETLQHFGSLTLVMITLTRKMFTMLLSVFLYNHKLTFGQWLGAAIVFSGISIEAFIKRRDVHAKRVIQEKDKAKIKSI